MESIVNVDGMIGDLSPATTITLTDPEATEVVSFTSSAADTATENVDDIAAQLVLAINNNVETPINFDAEYDQATKTIILTAERAGNTNPWTIIFDNNGVTNANAGNLGYTSSQTGEIINQMDVVTVAGENDILLQVNQSLGGILTSVTSVTSLASQNLIVSDYLGFGFFHGISESLTFNNDSVDKDFIINKNTSGQAFTYDAGTDTLTADAATTVVGFGGGADGLSITDTVNLNLLEGTTVLSTVTLPSSSGTTIIAGTANEIINTVSGDTNTLSLAPAITDAITANTAKVGITTAQSDAITSNTGKTGITVAQSNAIIANTAKVSNIDLLPLDNDFTGANTFSNTSGILATRVTDLTDTTTFIDFTNNEVLIKGTSEATIVAPGTLIVAHDEATDATMVSTPNIGVVFNFSRLDRDFNIRKLTTGEAFTIDSGSDTMTIGSDILTINSTTINGLPSKADALSISGQVLSLLDGTTSLSTVTLPAGGTATTVQGTSGQIGVNTVGNTATVSLDTAITGAITANTAKTGITTAQASAITTNTAKTGITTAQATAITNNTAKTGITTAQSDAITANTAKVSVAGLNQVGAAVLSTDSVVYYAGTALAPRRKTFNLVPLSIMNNDSGFITGITKANVDTAIGSGTLTTDYYASDKTWKSIPSGGTATTVLGTTGEIDVATVGTNATVSISSTITDAIDLNTAKQSVAGLTQVGGAIIASDSVLYYDGTVPRRKVFSSVPLSVFNNDSGFTTNTGTVTSVTGTANQINVANGTTTPVVSLNNTITSAITANTSKTGITTAQASAIVANTAKVSNVDILPLANTFTGTNTFNSTAATRSIQAHTISGVGDLDTYVDISNLVDNSIFLYGGGNLTAGFNATTVSINPLGIDIDFAIAKSGGGADALFYDSGTDTLTVDSNTTLEGFAGSETGTWTPVFQFAGTQGTTTATYSKVGNTVVAACETALATGALALNFAVTTASLPFTTSASSLSVGTFFNAATSNAISPVESGTVIIVGTSLRFFEKNSTTNVKGTDLLGYLSFTITYQTS